MALPKEMLVRNKLFFPAEVSQVAEALEFPAASNTGPEWMWNGCRMDPIISRIPTDPSGKSPRKS